SSRPTRARGLKQPAFNAQRCALMSRPTRARGLKLLKNRVAALRHRSRPTRARGLKRGCRPGRPRTVGVAPHAGAWIETMPLSTTARFTVVAPHAGAWIETLCGRRPGAG